MTSIKRPPRLVAVAAACVLALAACGGGDGSSGADQPAAGVPTITPTTTPTTTTADDHDDHDHDHDDHDHDDHDHDDDGRNDDDEASTPTDPEPAGAATEVDEPQLRLVVADGVEPIVRVVRYDDGETVASLDMPGTVAVADAGRYVLAAAREADRVEVVDPGTWSEPHGDHSHAFVSAPVVTGLGLDADDPTHVVPHGDLTAVFNDGDGSVVVVDSTALGFDDAIVATLDSGAAHHGVAVALAEHGVVILTTPVEGEALPDGVAVVDLASGEELQRFTECPGLHGEAATATVVAFGCADGVLVVESHEDHWHAHKIAPPDGTAADVRTGTLAAAGDTLVGNLGSGALVTVDLDGATATPIELPAEMSAFALTPNGSAAVVLTVDGRLHRIDPRSGEFLASVDVVDPFVLPTGHGATPVARVATIGARIFVTDPEHGLVLEFDEELAEVARFDVGGAPASVVLAG